MHTKISFILALWACLACVAPAQSVVNTAGGAVLAPNFMVEYSIGEPVTGTVGSPGFDGYYTAGVIQPTYWVVNGTEDAFDLKYHFAAHPNPASHQLSIETSYLGFRKFRFANVLGQDISAGVFDYSPLDMAWMPAGTYFLTLSSDDQQILKSIKIVKQ